MMIAPMTLRHSAPSDVAHGYHAENGSNGRHQHRPQPLRSRFRPGVVGGHSRQHELIGPVDEQFFGMLLAFHHMRAVIGGGTGRPAHDMDWSPHVRACVAAFLRLYAPQGSTPD